MFVCSDFCFARFPRSLGYRPTCRSLTEQSFIKMDGYFCTRFSSYIIQAVSACAGVFVSQQSVSKSVQFVLVLRLIVRRYCECNYCVWLSNCIHLVALLCFRDKIIVNMEASFLCRLRQASVHHGRGKQSSVFRLTTGWQPFLCVYYQPRRDRIVCTIQVNNAVLWHVQGAPLARILALDCPVVKACYYLCYA